MQQSRISVRDSSAIYERQREEGGFLGVADALSMLRRQAPVLAACAVLGGAGAALYAVTSPDRHWASASVLVDERLNNLSEDVNLANAVIRDESTLQNELEIIGSHRLARRVVEALDLHRDERFTSPPPSAQDALAGWIGDAVGGLVAPLLPASDPVERPPLTEDAVIDRAASRLAGDLDVRTKSLSYIIEIGYDSHDPELAAEVVGAYADAYIADQLEVTAQVAAQSSRWMESQLLDLVERREQAARAVEEFRAENGLLRINGVLAVEQNLELLNQELAEAESERLALRGLVQQFARLSAREDMESFDAMRGIADDAGLDPLAAALAEHRALAERVAVIRDRFGEDNARLEELTGELESLEGSVRREIARAREALGSRYELAVQRLEEIEGSMRNLERDNAEALRAGIELEKLQKQAETIDVIYQQLLSRYQELDVRSSFPVSSVRVVSPPVVPLSPYAPNAPMLLATGLTFGLLLGGLLGLARELLDRSLRTRDQVIEAGFGFLGYLPDIDRTRGTGAFGRAGGPGAKVLAALEGERDGRFATMLRHVLVRSGFFTPRKEGKVTAISSLDPGDGKTALAAGLAHALAASGVRVLLIDGDLRDAGLTRTFDLGDREGVAGLVATGPEEWGDAVVDLYGSGIHFLPAGAARGEPEARSLLCNRTMERLIAQAREAYEHVVLDLASVGETADAEALAPAVDRIVFVARWGGTRRRRLERVAEREPAFVQKIVGVVLNRTRLGKIKRFDPDYSY